MKLYFSPGACSLADHIALHEGGFAFEHIRVDLKTKTTRTGEDFTVVNPKGYVPVLVTDEGDTLTENVAILDYIAGKAPALVPQVRLARSRLLEMLAYIATELHKNFAPFFHGGSDADKREAADTLAERFAYLAGELKGDYLFGEALSAADCYLFVMLRWAGKNGIDLSDELVALRDRIARRPATQTALAHEE